MPDLRTREQIEEELFKTLQSARKRYEAKECSRDEYANALQLFSDLIIRGKLPDDPNAPVSSRAGSVDNRPA